MKISTISICIVTIAVLHFMVQNAESQALTQSIKGSVFDTQTKETLIGATIIVLNTEPLIGASTDRNGNFHISNAPLGRQSIQINFIGYEPVIIPELLVTSGREVILNMGLRQAVFEMNDVVILPDILKNKPLNTMSTVSSRSFSVEETRRYAGGLDDPARLVSAFAGVSVGNIQDNAIIVRGNSPRGVSWRVEGVEIPAPHHLAGGNVAGGGLVTMFSSQMLANSDFHTSAFPAEFGNALAGVFDMNLRTGNNGSYEHTLQAGTVGLDIASEGPLANGSSASYLFNYRYSTLGLLTDLNVIPSDQQIRYQDLSFKVNIPSRKAGTFSIWGIGGIDKALQPLETNPEVWENDWDRVSFDWGIEMGAAGLTHRLLTGAKTYINTTIAATGLENRMETVRQDNDLVPHPDLLANDKSGKLNLSSYVNHSLSPRLSTQTGINFKRLQYNLDISSTVNSDPESYQNVVDSKGYSYASEFYTQTRYQLAQNILINAGINISSFTLNKTLSIDPRVAASLDLGQSHSLSLGYGKHSQMEELKVYLVKKNENGADTFPNKDLNLSKAHHFVLAYDWRVNNNLRFKLEPYAQFLYDAPGIADSSFSMINYKQDWAFGDALENNSIGRNYGVDVTFERFMDKGFYFLITGSVFSSRYKADDGVWRNTRYNKNYVANALFGKEFAFNDNRRIIGINTRFNVVGGERVSPILEEKSKEKELVFFDEAQAFKNQLPTVFYTDLSFTFRSNRPTYSSVWALQVKNLLGQSTAEGFNYNYKTQSVVIDKSVVVVPSISYKIEF